MKFFFLIFIVLVVISVATKLLIIDQENKIKILNKKLLQIETQIEKLETDIAYIFSPHKLNEINQTEFNLKPIHQKNIIKLQNK
jgi:hypothetical protein|tara:strand:+ start:6557 stop:6808 length:252 start_codon:yes stop_codon:yes gene_type:complete